MKRKENDRRRAIEDKERRKRLLEIRGGRV